MNNIIAVIVTYNIGEKFKTSISMLKDHVKEIIVVDNGSCKETLEMIKSIEGIILIELCENEGIAYALNQGIKNALDIGCEWIITLDHDSLVDSFMIERMIEGYRNYADDDVAMITPRHIEESQRMKTNIYKDDNKIVLTEITSGAMVKSKVYSGFRMYDEKLFIDLVDHEYCLALNKHGYKILQVYSAILLHNLGESINKKVLGIELTYTNHNSIRRYYMSRNRFYVWEKYKNDFPEWIKLDKKKFIREMLKVLIFEKNKLQKIVYTYKGYEDYKKNIYGKLIIR